MGYNGLFTQLDMGKRSLTAQQAGMSVSGHNIANINNKDYSRQRVDLDPQHQRFSPFGSGVDINSVQRLADRFLTKRLIGEQARDGQLEIRRDALRRMENLFNDSEGLGLRSVLNAFWDSWGQLANEPESEIFRKELLTQSNSLANRFQGISEDLTNIRRELNGRVSLQVDKVNQLAKQIATQNKMVQQTERGSGETNDLRDQRESALRELSKLVDIQWFEDEEHLVNVSIGDGWPLVLGRQVNRLEASYDNEEVGYFNLKGIDPKGVSRELTKKVKSGEVYELLRMRDEVVVNFMDKLNQLASELSYGVNALHNSGTGLNSTFDKLTSSFALRVDAVAKPLPFVKDGSFRIQMVDDNYNKLQLFEVPIKAGEDSIRDIVDRINQVVGNVPGEKPKTMEATLNADGSVTLASRGSNRYILGDDDTGFAVMMGFNNFFENLQGAKDIRVNERLLRNPNMISTGRNLLPGNNIISLEIHALQFQPTMEGNSITYDEFYNGITSELGLVVNRANTEKKNQELVLDQFQKLRDEVSSVNMDEEVADMVQYQRGFEAAAKYINTVDEMTQTVINM